MKKTREKQDHLIEKYRTQMQNWKLIEDAGLIVEPRVLRRWARGFRRSNQGKVAENAQAEFYGKYMGKALIEQLIQNRNPGWKGIPKENIISVGWEVLTGRPVVADVNDFTRHHLTSGDTGSGKSTFQWWLIHQIENNPVLRKKIRIVIQDFGGEARRLTDLFPNMLILPIRELGVNLIHPVGDSNRYYLTFAKEISEAYRLHPSTAARLVNVLLSFEAGLKPGTPYMSMKDLEVALYLKGVKTKDSPLMTAARAIGDINNSLGKCARVQKSGQLGGEFNIIAIERRGHTPQFNRFFSSLWFYRFWEKSSQFGNDGCALKLLYVCDEGIYEVGKIVSSGFASNYISPGKQLLTQGRKISLGIMPGLQSIQMADREILSNISSYLCLKTPLREDREVAAGLLNLPRDKIDDLATLEQGYGWYKSIRYPFPVKMRYPNILESYE